MANGVLNNGNPRHASGGRPSRLRDPAYLKRVAHCFYAGMSRQSMCVELDVKDPDTITRWRRDPRVKAIVSKLNEDRALQISRKVDSRIEAILGAEDREIAVKDLILIRKEFGGVGVGRREVADDDTIVEAMDKLAENPNFAEDLRRLLSGDAEPQDSEAAPVEGE